MPKFFFIHFVLIGSRLDIMKLYFANFAKYTLYSINMKKKLCSLLFNLAASYVAKYFEKWATGSFGRFSQEHDSRGCGTIMLEKSKAMREDLQSKLREIIAISAETKTALTNIELSNKQRDKIKSSTDFKSLDEGMSQIKLASRGMHFLYEGDGYTIENNFPLAEHCYEAQIISLRSIIPVNIKWLAICHGRLGRLFLRQHRYDRAIFDFDRQLSLGNEIDDSVEIGDAYFGMGTGNLGIF